MNESVKEMAKKLNDLLQKLELAEDDQSAFNRWQRPVAPNLLQRIRELKEEIQLQTNQMLNVVLED